jgi:3-vinyl bacteriochlorophyllide hydratase
MRQHGTSRTIPSWRAGEPLYTHDQRCRRDATVWTIVQGVLAPVQFVLFVISAALVVRYLTTGAGAQAATVSIVVKTMALYAIMVTGSIWEKVVFGKWLFVPAFFWEDVFSIVVLALHTAYLVTLAGGIGTERERMLLALVAYAAYAINAGQFLWKLHIARIQAGGTPDMVARAT